MIGREVINNYVMWRRWRELNPYLYFALFLRHCDLRRQKSVDKIGLVSKEELFTWMANLWSHLFENKAVKFAGRTRPNGFIHLRRWNLSLNLLTSRVLSETFPRSSLTSRPFASAWSVAFTRSRLTGKRRIDPLPKHSSYSASLTAT